MHWLRSRHDLDDERVLIGVTAGVLWLVGALAAAFAQLLPGASGVHVSLFVGLDVAVIAYGVASIAGWIDWTRFSVRRHAIASAGLMPLIGVGLWATGGQDSYLQPMLVLPLVHVAYHFAPRVSLALIAELIVVEASPLAYGGEGSDAYLSRLLTFAVAALVLAAILRLLKMRMAAAEARQHEMARSDVLTGLANRRRFDEALHEAIAARGADHYGRRGGDAEPGFALVLFDLDGFKAVNDSRGHQSGDRLLRRVASHCAAVVRPSDTLARIGGDEFALLAPAAGEAGARRLAAELRAAIRAAGSAATVAYAVHPEDGADGETLLRTADRRLYEGKAVLAPQAP